MTGKLRGDKKFDVRGVPSVFLPTASITSPLEGYIAAPKGQGFRGALHSGGYGLLGGVGGAAMGHGLSAAFGGRGSRALPLALGGVGSMLGTRHGMNTLADKLEAENEEKLIRQAALKKIQQG